MFRRGVSANRVKIVDSLLTLGAFFPVFCVAGDPVKPGEPRFRWIPDGAHNSAAS